MDKHDESVSIDELHKLAVEAKDGHVVNDRSSDIRWKQFRLVVKDVSDDGTFQGYASVWSILDSDGEVVDKGSCLRSLKNNPNFVLLWQHLSSTPIGFCVEASEDDYGLKIKGKIALDCEAGRYAYAMLKLAKEIGGTAKMGLSIGFRAIDKKWIKHDDGKEHLHFTQIALLETSVVTWAANPSAFVTAVKSKFLLDGLAGEKEMSDHEKSATRMVDGAELGPSAFAFVGDPSDSSTFKLPIHFPTTEQSAAHIRDALARFDQTQGIPESEKPKVLARIRAAAHSHGIDVNKGTNPLTETKLMTSGDAQSSPDFDSNLAANQRQRVMDKQHSDIQGALYDTLSAIHGSDELTKEQKKSAITDCYQKFAGHMSNLHHQIIDQSDAAKSDAAAIMTKEDAAKFEEIIKSGAAGKVTAKLFASHKKTVDAVTKHTAAIQGAMADHAEVVKDLFGDDPGDNNATSTTSDEMGAMGDTTPINAKAEKSSAITGEKDGPALANNEQAVAGDPGSHSSFDELLAQSKTRLEQITSGRGHS